MTPQPTFSIVQLPKPLWIPETQARWNRMAEKFRTLRLRSLQIAPEAFASTYEAESQRGLDQTFDRLSNPKAHHFIAVQAHGSKVKSELDGRDLQSICAREWVGMIVLLGPMEGAVTAQADPFGQTIKANVEDASKPEPDIQLESPPSVEFVLNGVFVEPSVRKKGVGRALIDTALEHARSRRLPGLGAYVTVLVNAENPEACKLYEKAGFVVTGEEKYSQQPGAGPGENQARERVALEMRLALT